MKGTVVVLGAAGFSGWHFAEHCPFSDGLDLVGVDISGALRFHKCYSSQVTGDATDREFLFSVLEQHTPSFIVNFIGRFRAKGLDEYYRYNVVPTMWICDWAVRNECPVKKILIVGSAAEYGAQAELPLAETSPTKPVSEYGLSKLIQTNLAEFHHRVNALPIVSARTFNIVGEGLSTDLSMGSFARQIKDANDGDTVYVGNIETQRDFSRIEDVVKRYWILLQKGAPGEIYNVCSGEPSRIGDLLQRFIDISGKKIRVVVDPARLQRNDPPVVYGSDEKLRTLEGRT